MASIGTSPFFTSPIAQQKGFVVGACLTDRRRFTTPCTRTIEGQFETEKLLGNMYSQSVKNAIQNQIRRAVMVIDSG
jgi:hypothetical protein